MAALTLDSPIERRLQTEHNLWLATVRRNGRPHLVPIWFVWTGGKIYLCTASSSVKARNVLANPEVSAALEDGSRPVVIEGQARAVEVVPPAVVQAFQHKYDWNISTDDEYDQVFEIEPQRIRS
jgi:general stress protein 26